MRWLRVLALIPLMAFTITNVWAYESLRVQKMQARYDYVMCIGDLRQQCVTLVCINSTARNCSTECLSMAKAKCNHLNPHVGVRRFYPLIRE